MMLARFLGFGAGTDGQMGRAPSLSPAGDRPFSKGSTTGAGLKRPRRTPVLAHDRTLPEFEFDRRVAYWALTRTDPPTATFRLALYENHLRDLFDHDSAVEKALHDIRITDDAVANKTSGVRGFLVDMIVGVIRGTGRMRGLRTVLNVGAFEADVKNAIDTLQNNIIQYMISRIGVDKIIGVAMRALRDVSQEQTLAAQLKSTAQTIRKLEDLLARGRLMDEDIYELKLRRDLFLNALRLYARLTR